MPVSTQTLIQIAGWGGIIVATTGFYLKNKLIEKTRACEHYKNGMKTLRSHPGAIHFLGEPIKDRKFKISDTINNACDESKARFCVPVVGQKEKGKYYFWAEKTDNGWQIVRAELELQSKPDERRLVEKMNTKFIGTTKEKFYYHNTLLCLVQSLQGKNITVDLRNDSYVCGCVVSVDGFMNISLAKSVYCDTQGNEFLFENMFVQARNIRYVHVPETVPVLTAIRDELSKSQKSIKKPAAKSRKAKKALQLHMQTVASLDN